MHPELKALITEVCSREDCPSELRDALSDFLTTGVFPVALEMPLELDPWDTVFTHIARAWSWGTVRTVWGKRAFEANIGMARRTFHVIQAAKPASSHAPSPQSPDH